MSGEHAPVDPAALQASIDDIDAFLDSGVPLGEVVNPIALGESIMLVVHELKRLRARAPAEAKSFGILFEQFSGEISDQERERIRKTDLYKRGDTVAVWANEGDLYMARAASPAAPAPAAGAGLDLERIAESLASMLIEYIEGGINSNQNWRNGLNEIICARLRRLAPVPDAKGGGTMADLSSALAIAAVAHDGQLDKAGRPYFAHPLRMVARALAEHPEPAVAIAAALHDVVEDSAISFDDLRADGFSECIVDAVEALTRRDGEAYGAFLLRARANDLARIVKRLDVEDNLDPDRLSRIPSAAERFRLADKYAKALQTLAEEAGDAG